MTGRCSYFYIIVHLCWCLFLYPAVRLVWGWVDPKFVSSHLSRLHARKVLFFGQCSAAHGTATLIVLSRVDQPSSAGCLGVRALALGVLLSIFIQHWKKQCQRASPIQDGRFGAVRWRAVTKGMVPPRRLAREARKDAKSLEKLPCAA